MNIGFNTVQRNYGANNTQRQQVGFAGKQEIAEHLAAAIVESTGATMLRDLSKLAEASEHIKKATADPEFVKFMETHDSYNELARTKVNFQVREGHPLNDELCEVGEHSTREYLFDTNHKASSIAGKIHGFNLFVQTFVRAAEKISGVAPYHPGYFTQKLAPSLNPEELNTVSKTVQRSIPMV